MIYQPEGGREGKEVKMKDIELGWFRNIRIRIFFGIGMAIYLILLSAHSSRVDAAVSYDSPTNTIFLESGINTLASIFSEIGNPSVLDYDNGTNTYTLSAYISGRDGVDADLMLKDAILIFNNTTADKYSIKTLSDLTMKNMTIKPADYAYTWKIWVYSRFTGYSVNITDSDFSGGNIFIQPNGYGNIPTVPTIIENNYFHDYTTANGNEGMLAVKYGSAVNASIYNNIFKNIHLTDGQYNNVISFQEYSGCKIDKLYISDCTVNSYGMTYFYGAANRDNPASISNFEINNCGGDGLAGKEYGPLIYSNGAITNVSRDAIHFYYSPGYGHMDYYIWNVTIDGVGRRAISNNGYSDNYTVDIYDVKINDVDTVYWISGPSVYYITNSIATNYTTYFGRLGEAREYQLADIYVMDKDANPVENAVVMVAAVNPDVSDCVINRNLQALNQTVTLFNGHTPLPDEDKSKTLALLRYRKTSSIDRNYAYNITAEKNGYTATVTEVTPDESWYRENPDDYPGIGKGTIVITLPIEAKGKLTVFPNPYVKSKDVGERINFGDLPQAATIRIYTLSGELIKEITHKAVTEGGSKEWDISDIASGTYIYSIISPGGKATGKVSIVK